MTTLDLGPSDHYAQHSEQARVLLLACGALAREIVDLIEIKSIANNSYFRKQKLDTVRWNC